MSKLDQAMTAYAASPTEANRAAIVEAVAPEIATLKAHIVQQEESLRAAARMRLEAESAAVACRKELYIAAVNCEHHITDDFVKLVRDPSKPGNALSQLGDRLAAAAFTSPAAAPAPIQSAAPANEEFEELWNSHVGHPADFAADVLERWGGWPMGIMGYGGSRNRESDAIKIAHAALAAPAATAQASSEPTEPRHTAEKAGDLSEAGTLRQALIDLRDLHISTLMKKTHFNAYLRIIDHALARPTAVMADDRGGYDANRSEAWGKIVAVLDEVKPGWEQGPDSAVDEASKLIREWARPTAMGAGSLSDDAESLLQFIKLQRDSAMPMDAYARHVKAKFASLARPTASGAAGQQEQAKPTDLQALTDAQIFRIADEIGISYRTGKGIKLLARAIARHLSAATPEQKG
jgi:hypothetical protein